MQQNKSIPPTDYVFGDQENRVMWIPECDTEFEVIEFETGISGGAKTRGSRKVDIILRLVPSGVICYEMLIFAPSMAWKIDTFVKSTGITAVKGQSPAELLPGNERLLVGLRGWCRVSVEEYKKPTDGPDVAAKKRNKVAVWFTDRPKLPRKPAPAADVSAADPDDRVPF